MACLHRPRKRKLCSFDPRSIRVKGDPLAMILYVGTPQQGMTQNLLQPAVASYNLARGLCEDDAHREVVEHRLERLPLALQLSHGIPDLILPYAGADCGLNAAHQGRGADRALEQHGRAQGKPLRLQLRAPQRLAPASRQDEDREIGPGRLGLQNAAELLDRCRMKRLFRDQERAERLLNRAKRLEARLLGVHPILSQYMRDQTSIAPSGCDHPDEDTHCHAPFLLVRVAPVESGTPVSTPRNSVSGPPIVMPLSLNRNSLSVRS